MDILKHRANTETFNLTDNTISKLIRSDTRNDIVVLEALEQSLKATDEYLILEPFKTMDFNTLLTSYVYRIYVNVAT